MAVKKEKDVKWLELCQYVEKEIFNYNSDQKLQRKASLMLQGLKKGQCVANNNHEQYGEYSYNVILLAFKANKMKILNALKGKRFASESNKMSYICAIVRDSINDIHIRYNTYLMLEEKIEQVNTQVITHEGAEYKARDKQNKKLEEKFRGLW